MSLTFPSLVLSEGEVEDDADHGTKEVAATDDNEDDNNDDDDEDNDNNNDNNDGEDNDNDNNNNNNHTTMPLKVKPMATAASKTAEKTTKKADEIALLPAPKLPNIRTFSIKAEDPLTVSYYTTGKHGYANVVFRVNGTIDYGEYEVQVAKDGHSILFVRAIRAKLFDKTILKKIMGQHYHKGSARIIALDNTVQEMEGKKVYPQNGLYWGKPQVAQLKWK